MAKAKETQIITPEMAKYSFKTYNLTLLCLFICVAFVLLVSCDNNEKRIESQSLNMQRGQQGNVDALSLLSEQIDSLSCVYSAHGFCAGSVVPTKRLSSEEADEEQKKDTETLKQNDDEIFNNDALGFTMGTILDSGVEGTLLGSLIAPGPGSVVGTMIDKAIAGLAMGVFMSVMTARDRNADSTYLYTDVLWNVDDWISGGTDELLFDPDIVGANMGYYHNLIIRDVWHTDLSNMVDLSFMLWMTDDLLMNYITESIERLQICTISDKPLFCQIILENRNDINVVEYQGGMFFEIIHTYLETVRNLSPDAQYTYTDEIFHMTNNSELDMEGILMLNGTFSTFYYSMSLWNMDAINNRSI